MHEPPALRFDAQGLIPAVVQDDRDQTVLMVGWMDAEAVRRTLTTGRTWFWSRSRQAYWCKGETSGHVQHVRSVAADCDGDTLLVRVEQVGPACHTGTRSCFATDLGAVPGTPEGTADLSRATSSPGAPDDGGRASRSAGAS